MLDQVGQRIPRFGRVDEIRGDRSVDREAFDLERVVAGTISVEQGAHQRLGVVGTDIAVPDERAANRKRVEHCGRKPEDGL